MNLTIGNMIAQQKIKISKPRSKFMKNMQKTIIFKIKLQKQEPLT